MKKIELTAEWILDKLSEGVFCDGNGNCILYLYNFKGNNNITQFFLLQLAFDQMGIKYETGDYYDPNDTDNSETRFKFKINDIKDFCPNLYLKFKEDNYHNSYNYRRKQKLNKLNENNNMQKNK